MSLPVWDSAVTDCACALVLAALALAKSFSFSTRRVKGAEESGRSQPLPLTRLGNSTQVVHRRARDGLTVLTRHTGRVSVEPAESE